MEQLELASLKAPLWRGAAELGSRLPLGVLTATRLRPRRFASYNAAPTPGRQERHTRARRQTGEEWSVSGYASAQWWEDFAETWASTWRSGAGEVRLLDLWGAALQLDHLTASITRCSIRPSSQSVCRQPAPVP
jgi:hypothetical protein